MRPSRFPSPYIYMYILTAFFFGCTEAEDRTVAPAPEVHIIGNGYDGFMPDSRTDSEKTEFKAGDRILFFCEGGISTEGYLTLTFDGDQWQSEEPLAWNRNEEIRFAAVYPALETDEQGNIGKEQLYESEGNRLKDILFCQGKSTNSNIIRLEFRHRFTQFNLIPEQDLEKRITDIRCATEGIETFSPKTGGIIYSGIPRAGGAKESNEGVYSLILPPSGNGGTQIELSVSTSDGTVYHKKLDRTVLSGGKAYTSRVRMQDSGTGIYTAEDFIAFTHLINGEPYGDRTLEEFGEMADGQMTYYLKNDIEFTPEESGQIVGIGKYNKDGYNFTDVFDGLGHTLSNITLDRKLDGYSNYGIFGYISATGIVRNLNIRDISYEQDGNIGYIGLLAGTNEGKIHNCSVRESNMKIIDPADYGSKSSIDYSGMVCFNKGTIANCHIGDVTISTKDKYSSASGITKYNYGDILNCYIHNVAFSGANSGAYLCFENRGNLQNCYIYGSEGRYNAVCVNTEDGSFTGYCYFPDTFGNSAIKYGNGGGNADIRQYNIQTRLIENTDQLLHEKLNAWIDETGGTAWPDMEFYTWQTDINLPAILILP